MNSTLEAKLENYTLHSKLFKCTLRILNYDHCYTLHDIKLAINLDEKIWHNIK